MGKTSDWFRSLLGSKKSPPESSPARAANGKKSKWGAAKSADTSSDRSLRGGNRKNAEDPSASPYVGDRRRVDADRHAVAVAAATEAVAKAAMAAAKAAAEVVRMTRGGARSAAGNVGGDRRRVAAVKIQAGFRAYLARRAFRALRSLVKLQALVRGRIVRKQTTEMLNRMQAMARIQARASAHRAYISDSGPKVEFSNYCHPSILGRNERRSNSDKQNNGYLLKSNSRSPIGSQASLNHWFDRWTEQHASSSREVTSISDKILEVDTWKPRQNQSQSDKTYSSSQYFSSWNETGQSYSKNSRSPLQVQNPNPSTSSEEIDRVQLFAATPTRSLVGDQPSYMANTESFRAKVRSQSTPRQRMQFEERGVDGKFGQGILWESDTNSEKGFVVSDNRRNNGYVTSQGTNTLGGAPGLSSPYGRRF